MTIETKFNLDEVVYFLKGNKIRKATISAIATFHAGTNQDQIVYNAKDFDSPVTWLDYEKIPESELFTTRELLLQSL